MISRRGITRRLALSREKPRIGVRIIGAGPAEPVESGHDGKKGVRRDKLTDCHQSIFQSSHAVRSRAAYQASAAASVF